MEPLSLITALASVVPGIVRWIAGDRSTAAQVAQAAGDLAMSVTGKADPAAAVEELKLRQDCALRFQQMWNEVEVGVQEQLTRRHEADMKSDSWLSKNVRPLCLLVLTCAILAGVFAGTVPEAKFGALTDLAAFVFGYYFVGRTAEKGVTLPGFGSGRQR